MTQAPVVKPFGPPAPRTPIAIGGWRTVIFLTIANVSMYSIFQGMQQILLPTQVETIDPAGKVNDYGILASLGALAAAIANPTVGGLSDRTRTRWGKRTPWLVCSAVLAAFALLILSGMTTLFTLGAAYVVVMFVMGAFQSTVSVILPDRVYPARMGTAASIVGMATSIGVLIGVNVAARLTGTPWAGYGVLGAFLIATTILFVVVCPDPTRPSGPGVVQPSEPTAKAEGFLASRAAASGGQGLTAAAEKSRGFFSALADHDFRWAFIACVSIMLGYWVTTTYILYTLTDYIGAENLPGMTPPVANAMLTSITMICMFVTTVISGPLSDKLGRRKIFVIVASLGVTACSLIPVFFPTWPGMVVYIAFAGLFFGCYMAVDRAIMTLVLPDKSHAARDLGLTTIATTGPQVAGPLLAAVIISSFGGYAFLYVFAAAVALIAAFAVLPIRKLR